MNCTGAGLSDEAAGLAMGLTVGAGAATMLGAAVPFLLALPCCLRCRRPHALDVILAAGLAFAAGVMLFVSFVEILPKGRDAFLQCLDVPSSALASSGAFFGGMLITWLLMLLVHLIHSYMGHAHRSHRRKPGKTKSPAVIATDASVMDSEVQSYLEEQELQRSRSTLQLVEGEGEEAEGEECAASYELTVLPEMDDELGTIEAVHQADSRRRLVLMTVFAALAVSLHNLPEGLATFVAVASTTDDQASGGGTGVGVLFAVAIAAHNIPEGMVVSIPVYHITKSKWKAFLWGSLSGFTEPIGGLLGWAVLGTLFTGVAYGVIFSGVAGMMVYLCLKELLPTAHRYDPKDRVVTWSWLCGFVIMAVSLVLFLF